MQNFYSIKYAFSQSGRGGHSPLNPPLYISVRYYQEMH